MNFAPEAFATPSAFRVPSAPTLRVWIGWSPPGGDLLVHELGEAGLEERWLAPAEHVDLLGVGVHGRDVVAPGTRVSRP
jgi:hypothetical protein